MNIVKNIKRIKLATKMALCFVFLAMIPMVAIALYSYTRVKNTFLEKSYAEIQQSAETLNASINTSLQAYSTLLDMLYMDAKLNNYITQDYSNQSTWNMFSYIDKEFKQRMVMYPSIYRMNIFSSNETLPQDHFYFYRLTEWPSCFADSYESVSAATTIRGIMESGGKRYFGMLKKMNYYLTGSISSWLMLQVDSESISTLLGQNSDMRRVYLIDANGVILASSAQGGVGSSIDTIVEPAWLAQAEHHAIFHGSSGKMDMILHLMPMDYDLKLLITENTEYLIENAVALPKRILLMALVLSLMAFGLILVFSRRMSNRIKRIIDASNLMGKGVFDIELENMGNDEISEIALAYNMLSKQMKKLIQENYEKGQLAKSSEMNLIQEQVNPHFLYNALSVISSIAMQEADDRTQEAIQMLASFYRFVLNKGRQTVRVRDEIEILESYMRIQKLRFGESVQIHYTIDESLLDCLSLKLILQPLVENAIHHGMLEEQPLHITVTIYGEDGCIVYAVQDDGCGIPPEELENILTAIDDSTAGFGLKNVANRIHLAYGEPYGISIESTVRAFTRVAVRIPQRYPQ